MSVGMVRFVTDVVGLPWSKLGLRRRVSTTWGSGVGQGAAA